MPAPDLRVSRQPLPSAVPEALRNRILTGDLTGGTQLRQEALSQEFGVSRVPVREALRQLEAEGLVRIFDHRGAVVTELSLDDVRELLDIRALVESDLLLRAVPRQCAADIDEAAAALAEFETALARHDIAHWGTLNARFHIALYRAAGRPQTMALVESLHNRTDRYTRMQILLTNFADRAQAEHPHLLALCRSKDAIGAAAFLRQHVLNAADSLDDWFARRDGTRTALSAR